MTLTQKRILILCIVIICGVVFGWLVLRELMNMMLGGTLFGGNFL